MIRPAVSIVMPVYNGRRYLAESVESVLAQTWPDFELVICDDGSSDDSYQICAAYRDPRIRLLRNPTNRGLFANLNRLVQESRAPIVRFWSQDDRMKPHCLQAEQDFRAAHGEVALTYCQRDVIDEHGAVVARPAFDPTPEVIEPWLSNQIAVYHGCLQGNISTVAVRRHVLDEAGPFAEHFRVSGDFELWTRISTRHPIGFIRHPLIDLRAHAGQFSRSPRERLAFIREDRSVIERLLGELEPDMQRYARAYRRRRQDVWTMHYLLACIARGDWQTARQVVGELRRTGPVLPVLARWLATANGAWFRPEPLYRKPAPALARAAGGRAYATQRPIRVTAVLTHPVQYYSPWFRDIQAHAPELDLTVLYATEPTPQQQGVGFGRSFEWDVPLRTGYRSYVLRPARPGDSVSSDDYRGIDVPEVGEAIAETAPDVVIVPGWYSITLVRALRECRRRGIPVLYRGDTHSNNAPSGWRRLAWRAKTARLLRAYAGYLCPGQRVRDHLLSFGAPPSRIFHTPHCVDNAFFADAAQPYRTTAGRAAARAALGLAPDRFVVMFAGKLTTKKRPLDVIRAVAPRAGDSTVLMVGSGPLEEACRREAARLGVQVAWAGFLNQSEMARAYACADCLVLPSDWGETWGLVVNEALAVGVPCVVSDRVGCAPDLIDDATGAVVPFGDVAALAAAIDRVRERLAVDPAVAAACRARAAQASITGATRGLLTACREVTGRSSPRVVACFGHMVELGGLERMSFEVLTTLTDRSAGVHCMFNPWEHNKVVAVANRIGATWQTGYYWYSLRRRPPSPRAAAQMIWDIVATSRGTFKAARAFRATHVFVPDYVAVVRNMFALARLRLLGVQVILRLGHAPEPGEFHGRLWRQMIAPLADRIIGNSEFIGRELLAAGVPAAKVSVIPNRLAPREATGPSADPRDPSRVVFVGQLIPEKGVDLLLDAVALLVDRFPRITLDVVGRDQGWVSEKYSGYRERLKARASDPDLAGRVRFIGWRDDIPKYMAGAAVHCCPSRPEQREGFGNVVLEAKASATPSVVSDVGGLPELVRHQEDGWICRACTPEAIAEGLAYFLASEPVRARAGLRALASLERYNGQRFADAWWRVFAPYTVTPPSVGIRSVEAATVVRTDPSPRQPV